MRAGLEQRLVRIKRATRAYVRDRARQATGTAASYAVAASLFIVAGILLIGAGGVGLMALFRYVELQYGTFPAFGAVGGLLLLLAMICAIVATIRLKRPAPSFPSLGSRLRVAVAAPASRDPAAGDVDPEAIPLAPSAPKRSARGGNAINVPVGLAVAAILLGWAAMRRRQR